MAMDEQEFQEQLFEDIGEMKDALNLYAKAVVTISDRQGEMGAVVDDVYKAVTKEVEGDSLYQVLRDIHAAIERNNTVLARVEARLIRTA